MIRPVFIVAFAGNRPKDEPGRLSADIEAMGPRIEEMLLALSAKAGECGGEIHLFSGVAEGADTLACEVAHDLGIPVHVILPMDEESFKEDFTRSPEAWRRTSALIARARTGYNRGTLRVASSAVLRDECYAHGSDNLLDVADLLFTVTNGVATNQIGGTTASMEAAKVRGIPVLHLLTVRGQDPGPLQDVIREFANPDEGSLIIDSLRRGVKSAGLTDDPKSGEQLFELLDSTAKALKRDVSSGSRFSIWLHGSASLLAAAGVSYALAGGARSYEVLLGASLLELVLLCLAEGIHHRDHGRKVAEGWLNCRFAAEILRPRQVIAGTIDPLKPLVTNQFPAWRRFCISSYLMPGGEAKIGRGHVSIRDHYLEKRIQHQIQHFSDQSQAIRAKVDYNYKLIRSFAYSAIVVVVLTIAYKVYSHSHGGGHHDFDILMMLAFFLPIALPLLTGILSALRNALDHGRRAVRYDHMVEVLEAAAPKLKTSATMSSLETSIREVESSLLYELNEFYILQKVGLKH